MKTTVFYILDKSERALPLLQIVSSDKTVETIAFRLNGFKRTFP